VSLIFIHNSFKGLRGKSVACVACTGRYLKKAELTGWFSSCASSGAVGRPKLEI
jgi:hypothetical protein